MSEPRDPILDTDLDAYIDDQLDVARRIEVEAYLSVHPDAAARVMSDMRTRDELRLALAASKGMARLDANEAARRLERGLSRDRLLGGLQRIAAIRSVCRGRLVRARSGRSALGDGKRRVDATARLCRGCGAGPRDKHRQGWDGLPAGSLGLRPSGNPRGHGDRVAPAAGRLESQGRADLSFAVRPERRNGDRV